MTKFFGKIGFYITEETSPGVWTSRVVTKNYRGDVTKNYHRYEQSDSINDNFNISNNLSIVADFFCYENIGMIRFVEWMGSLWDVTGIELQRPRVLLTIGGVYNGPEPDSEEEDTTPPDSDGDNG